MTNASKPLALAAAALAVFLAAAPAAHAGLTLSSGENSGISSTNNYGSAGTYWSGSPQSYQAHPNGGPVAILFVLNPDLTFSLYTDSSAGPYDGTEDTQIGVLNLANATLTSLTITGPNATFGFEGDGIDNYGSPGNATDTTGYGGPITYFSNIHNSQSTGTANFIGGIGSGGHTYFSLELNPTTLTSGGITSNGGTVVPEPSTLLSTSLGGLLGLGYLWRRRRRAASAV